MQSRYKYEKETPRSHTYVWVTVFFHEKLKKELHFQFKRTSPDPQDTNGQRQGFRVQTSHTYSNSTISANTQQ